MPMDCIMHESYCNLSHAHFLENNEASCYLLLTDYDWCMQYVRPDLQTKWRKWAISLNLKQSNRNVDYKIL
jgi:hypothetical protein